MPQNLELLAPAKNLIQGREAINHGADAVYIGPPSFGARVGASNSLADIEQLIAYAHLYHAKVYVTLNTILYDDEIEAAARLVHQLYDIGVDAILVQDMGLLQCDLPPIELHASTQTHNATPQRVAFLQSAGFSRVVLARETSIEQMQLIRQNTTVELEAFVGGALCVSYSGQCYMSEFLTRRSGNRGCCTQPCRSAYDLVNQHGTTLVSNQHLLSLRDFSAAQHIEAMADAGIISFKIEGRLKDMAYVKNVTAFYRQLLDNLLQQRHTYSPASSGHTSLFFTPDIERTFNRGFTDYFLRQRQPMASFATQKSVGKKVASVLSVHNDYLTVNTLMPLHAGDGLCYIADNSMTGFMVNRVEGNRLFPNKMPSITKGTTLYRNNDIEFERLLQGNTAERKIGLSIIFSATSNSIQLHLTDEDGTEATSTLECAITLATNALRARQQVQQQLTKLGDTCFSPTNFEDHTPQPLFLPAALLNALRRSAIDKLIEQRLQQAFPKPHQRHDSLQQLHSPTLDYSYNIVNHHAETFYRLHGATSIEPGVELSHQFNGKALMTTKYCLRFELGQCLQLKNNSSIAPEYQCALMLRNNKQLFELHFDCQQCQMLISAHNDKQNNKPKTHQ